MKCAHIKRGNKLRIDEEEVKKLFKNNGCELLSEYKNSRTPVKYKCVCGEKSEITVSEFKRGTRCIECGRKKAKDTKEEKYQYSEEFQRLFEEEGYEMLELYKGAKNKILLKCPKGHEKSMKPANFKTGNRCGECSEKRKKTFEEVKERFEEENYIMISTEYVEAFSKLEVVCPKGHEVEISWDNFNQGKRCGICKESKGEKRIAEYLVHNAITYERQQTFDDCKDKRKLPFDFAIFNENKDIIQLIEYDGHQHFQPIDFFGGEKAFKLAKKHDKIKTKYCKKKKIPLLRIRYWEFEQIEEILNERLIAHIEKPHTMVQ